MRESQVAEIPRRKRARGYERVSGDLDTQKEAGARV